MPSDTGSRDQLHESGTVDAPHAVHLERTPAVDLEYLVLAYRHDGEPVELAERTATAAAALHRDSP